MSITGLAYSAASGQLAQALYYARLEAFELEGPAWEFLEPGEKRVWVQRAQEVLETLRPAPRRGEPDYFDYFTRITREHAKVIGAITPREPWGIDPRD